jgi:AraC-like DNA-binding protein
MRSTNVFNIRHIELVLVASAKEIRSLVLSAANDLDVQVQGVSWKNLLRMLVTQRRFAGVVYGLTVGREQHLSVLGEVHNLAPGMPALAIGLEGPGIESLLQRCSAVPTIRTVLHCPTCNGDTNIREQVEQLIGANPALRVGRWITSSVSHLPPRAFEFMGSVLEGFCYGWNDLPATVGQIAAMSGMSERTLERAWSHSLLPPPHEFISWLTLLYLTLSAEVSRARTVALARSIGMDSRKLYHLRRRLLSHAARQELRAGSDELSVVVREFARRCGLAAGAPGELLKGTA